VTDRRQVPVETTEGWRPSSSGGERIIVALAGVALLGAVLIVAGNLLHKDDTVSVASASPRPTSRPSPTPRPSPAQIEVAVVPESATPGPSTPLLFGGWIRANEDLTIRTSPDDGASVVGTLPAGALAFVDEQAQGSVTQGWSTIEAPDPIGWVATRAGGKDLVQRFQAPDYPVSGQLYSLAAGPDGFLAIGNAAGTSSAYPPPTLFTSRDGANWHAASDPPAAAFYPAGAAWGPEGWLVVGSDPEGEGTRVWSSPDGDHWTLLGALQAGYPQGLAGSSLGYLLQGSSRGFGIPQNAWFSADGIHWSASDAHLGGYYQVTATTSGFYATITPGIGNEAGAAFSTDGRTWSPNLPHLFVASVGGALLGIEAGPDGRGGHPMRGSFYHGLVGWRPVTGGDGPFAGAVVTTIVSDGRQATAFGWNLTTEASLSWTSTGGPWTRHELPSTYSGPPMMAAARDGGVVLVGNRWNPRGPNPVIWHQDADGQWQPEGSPVLGMAVDPSTGLCDRLPTSPIEFVNLDRAAAVACHRDAPLTVRLWSSRCDGCYGGSDGLYDQEWLSSPSSNVLFLSPVKWRDQWSSTAVLPPAMGAPDPSWLDAWLELTGHFDDPASASCRWNPPPEELQFYAGAAPIIEACREQFVVTALRVVSGP
jgi:hypothetical protein